MKSLYGSITRSAVISLSYVTAMRLPSLSPSARLNCRGRPHAPTCRAQPEGGGPGRLQRIVRPGLASIRLATPFVLYLRTFHDAEVALRAGAECLKRLLVSLAFVSRPGDVIAVEFDKDRRLLQSSLVGLHLARGHGQKARAE